MKYKYNLITTMLRTSEFSTALKIKVQTTYTLLYLALPLSAYLFPHHFPYFYISETTPY